MNNPELENKLAIADFIVVNNGCGILTCTKNVLFDGVDCPLMSSEDQCRSNEEIVEMAKKFIESNSEVVPTKCVDNNDQAGSEKHQSNLEKILAERNENYGSFEDFSLISQRLKAVIASSRDRSIPFAADVAEAIEMICHKIARIVNGRDDYADSWYDIAGYATLIASRIDKEKGK